MILDWKFISWFYQHLCKYFVYTNVSPYFFLKKALQKIGTGLFQGWLCHWSDLYQLQVFFGLTKRKLIFEFSFKRKIWKILHECPRSYSNKMRILKALLQNGLGITATAVAFQGFQLSAIEWMFVVLQLLQKTRCVPILICILYYAWMSRWFAL